MAWAQQEAEDDENLDALPTVVAIRVSSTTVRARLVIDMGSVTAFSFVSLADPIAIAIDVHASGLEATTDGVPSGEGVIASYTLEQIEADRVRTVLLLNEPMQVQQAYMLDPFDDQPARLVVDLIAESSANFSRRVENDLADSTQNIRLEEGGQVANTPDTTLVPAQTRPLILIDPGHGGIDSGAKTLDGVEEKTITLVFARRLQEILIETGKYDVALSRNDDTFMRLEDRVQVARDNKADLLISVHADTFEDTTIRGASVYTRDEQASDVLDKVLAEQENRVDLLAGYDVPEEEDAVVNILVDLMRREMRRQSFIVADLIVQQLKASVRVRRFPLRRADFFVLQSPDVPSILLELGFLSNDSDARNLTSPQWRERVAAAVARGIEAYFDRPTWR